MADTDTPPTSAPAVPTSREGRLASLFERFNLRLHDAAQVALEIAEQLGEASEQASLDATEVPTEHTSQLEAKEADEDRRAHTERAGYLQRRAGLMIVLASFLRGDHDADLIALLKGEPL